MENHIHLVAVPDEPHSLAVALRRAHGRYALYLNARRNRTGHLWQNRFYSCPLDRRHLWVALRYVERNPVRANLVARSEQYAWSSAAAHLGTARTPEFLDWGVPCGGRWSRALGGASRRTRRIDCHSCAAARNVYRAARGRTGLYRTSGGAIGASLGATPGPADALCVGSGGGGIRRSTKENGLYRVWRRGCSALGFCALRGIRRWSPKTPGRITSYHISPSPKLPPKLPEVPAGSWRKLAKLRS